MIDELEVLRNQINWLWDYATGRTEYRPFRMGWETMQAEYRELTGYYWDPVAGTETEFVLNPDVLKAGD